MTAPSVANAAGDETDQAASNDNDNDLGQAADRPWARDVPPERQRAARDLFFEGNALVRESLFVQAVPKYEQALELWDHPGIHYNLALALLNLDQPLTLRRHLLAATQYGAESLGSDKYLRATQYLDLVEKQLTKLVVECAQPNVRVSLDGDLLFTGPGRFEDFIRPGQHAITASSEGYEPSENSLKLVPGDTRTVRLKLYKEEDWVHYTRRWDFWGPVVVTGVGAAVLTTGGFLYWHGEQTIRDYDDQVRNQCGIDGCGENPKLGAMRDRAERLQVAGVVGMAVGGAALATGGVLLYLNRITTYRVDPNERDAQELAESELTFTPTFGPGFAGLAGTGRF
jgi:hypothetical protein